MSTFNFWFVFAPLGVIVAASLGHRLYQRHRYAQFVGRVFATLATSILLILLFEESYDDVLRFCLCRDESAMADFTAIFIIVTMAVAYGFILRFLADYCEYLNYPSYIRRALRQARRENPDIKYVITPRVVQDALDEYLKHNVA